MSIPTEDLVTNVINHKIRRQIFTLLKDESKSFSELYNYFDLSSSKLTYHLKQMKGFIEKTQEGSYKLTSLGVKTLQILNKITEELNTTDQIYVREAFNSQKKPYRDIVILGLNIFIAVTSILIILFVSLFFSMILLIPNPPPIFIISCIISVTISALFWYFFIRMKSSVPAILERLERKLKK